MTENTRKMIVAIGHVLLTVVSSGKWIPFWASIAVYKSNNLGRKIASSLIFTVALLVIISHFTGFSILGNSIGGNAATMSKEVTEHEQVDWKKLANSIILDYQGDIVAIEQLNARTVWVVCNPSLPPQRLLEIAGNVGHYVRLNTGGLRKGKTPSVHVFQSKKHIAVARRKWFGTQYVSKIDIANWDPSTFSGEYRP